MFSGESIADAARSAPADGVVVVAPGIYSSVELDPGDLQGSLTLVADVTGELTESSPAPVTIIARSGDVAGIQVFSQSGLTIDGFTIRGGTDAGIIVGDSSSIIVRNCTVTRSGGDAVDFERSQDVLLFNNLLSDNQGSGVTALGTTDLRIINNTIYKNTSSGIFLGLDENEQASTNAFVTNNILHQNTPTGLIVDIGPPSSLDGFVGDFNLNTNGYEGADPGLSDVADDPLFISAAGGDFRLAAPSSPALDRATDAIDADLVNALQQRSTQTDGSLDAIPLDLGYHYAAPILTPTKVPKPTRTGTPTATATRTGGTPGATATPTRTSSRAPTATTTPAGRPTRPPKPTRTPNR